MTKFYRIIYTIAAPIIHLLFPCRVVGLEDFPEEGIGRASCRERV